jgi:hypothetical protein
MSATFTFTNGFLNIQADAIPFHSPGTFPNPSNSNTIEPQNFDQTIIYRGGVNIAASTPVQTSNTIIGFAMNGVPIYSPNAGSQGNPAPPQGFNYNINHSTFLSGKDQYDAFPDVDGVYHYITGNALKNGWDSSPTAELYQGNYYDGNFWHPDGHSKIYGVALDGYPIYSYQGYADPLDPLSGIKVITSSYRIKNNLPIVTPLPYQRIEFTESISSSLDGVEKYYRFIVSSTSNVNIVLDLNPGATDIDLELQTNTGFPIANSVFGSDKDEFISARLSPGEYIIKVFFKVPPITPTVSSYTLYYTINPLNSTPPSVQPLPIVRVAGQYIQDYEYVVGLGDLDQHNGRFCKTPDFPNGTYAYFFTFTNDGGAEPTYPYVTGPTYYGNPVEIGEDPTVLTPGSGASLSPNFNSENGIDSVTVLAGGSGYQKNNPPILRIVNAGNAENPAVLQPVIFNGSIVAVKVLESGSGYDPLRVEITSTPVGEGEVQTQGYGAIAKPILREDNVIATVTITNQGSGYTSKPTIVLNGGGGVGAQLNPLILNGKLVDIEIVNRGGGYTSNPVVEISSEPGVGFEIPNIMNYSGQSSVQQNSVSVGLGNPTWGPAIQANPSNYEIIFNGGLTATIASATGTASPGAQWTFTGTWPANSTGAPLTIRSKNYVPAGGSGAAATVTISDGSISYVQLISQGDEYFGPTSVEILGYGGAGANASASTNSVTSLTILNPGKNYTEGDVGLVIQGGNGIGAAGKINVDNTGYVSNISITDPGEFYEIPPYLIIEGGNGTGAKAKISVENGELNNVEILNGGKGYTTAPKIVLARKSKLTRKVRNRQFLNSRARFMAGLLTDVERDTTTMYLSNTNTFLGSGKFYIENEIFSYTTKNEISVNGCVRGENFRYDQRVVVDRPLELIFNIGDRIIRKVNSPGAKQGIVYDWKPTTGELFINFIVDDLAFIDAGRAAERSTVIQFDAGKSEYSSSSQKPHIILDTFGETITLLTDPITVLANSSFQDSPVNGVTDGIPDLINAGTEFENDTYLDGGIASSLYGIEETTGGVNLTLLTTQDIIKDGNPNPISVTILEAGGLDEGITHTAVLDLYLTNIIGQTSYDFIVGETITGDQSAITATVVSWNATKKILRVRSPQPYDTGDPQIGTLYKFSHNSTIVDVRVMDFGQLYTTTPTLSIETTGLLPASASATLTLDQLTSTTVIDGGYGYDPLNPPEITVIPNISDTTGTGAVVEAILGGERILGSNSSARYRITDIQYQTLLLEERDN